MTRPQIISVNSTTPPATNAETIPAVPGTYALILNNQSTRSIPIGKLGLLTLQPGFYIYTGSAFGPGGLRARLSRHLNPDSKLHCHIDHLRRTTKLVEIWYWPVPDKLEHKLAKAFQSFPGATIPLPRFGASDCNCEAHLFYFKIKPELTDLEILTFSFPKKK